MEKIESQKGKELLLNDGFRYRKARVNADGSASWRCVEANCKGRLKVVEDSATTITEHGHPADFSKNEAAKSVAEMRRRAAEGVEKPRQIIQHSTAGISNYQHIQHLKGQSNEHGRKPSSRIRIQLPSQKLSSQMLS